MWARVCFGAVVIAVIGPVIAQELNILPDLLKPYLYHAEDRKPINFLGNVSEKIFNFKRIGFKFGEKWIFFRI